LDFRKEDWSIPIAGESASLLQVDKYAHCFQVSSTTDSRDRVPFNPSSSKPVIFAVRSFHSSIDNLLMDESSPAEDESLDELSLSIVLVN